LKNIVELKKGYLNAFLWLIVSLFFIPVTTYIFTEYGINSLNHEYTQFIVNDARSQHQDAESIARFMEETPPSTACGKVSEDLIDYQNVVCSPQSEMWQFFMMDRLALWSVLASGFIIVMIFLLSAMAFQKRSSQLLSLNIARPFLMVMCSLEVLLQGGMLVWLSFWGTAFFTQAYYPKLVIAVGFLVLAGMYYMLRGIFKKLPPDKDTDGELLSPECAPALWSRIEDLSTKVGTNPPDHIIAGIDTNFYVTEAQLQVAQKTLTGRKLYVSIPLLRHLSMSQADSVMVHELTHFHQGDTASGALLGPKLHQFDLYMSLMRENLSTLIVFYPLYVYRLLFELAYQRNSRQREFIADRNASSLISEAAIVESLIKVSAYSNYRNEVEKNLFARNVLHEKEIGISKAIVSGLTAHVNSPDFISVMRKQNVPHPFDSHPPVTDRMVNLNFMINESDYAEVAALVPQDTWVDLIPCADDVEQRLWQEYEQDFTASHEESLAWRYKPSGEDETTLVLKYFPDVSFTLKNGDQVKITWQGILHPKTGEMLEWGNVKKMNIIRNFGRDILYVQHVGRNNKGKKRSEIRLPGLKKEIEVFKATSANYWRRYQCAEEFSKSPE
jgi:Zn-dependent protease with chaperone function